MHPRRSDRPTCRRRSPVARARRGLHPVLAPRVAPCATIRCRISATPCAVCAVMRVTPATRGICLAICRP